MVAFPGDWEYTFVVQDAVGNVATVRFPDWDGDVSSDATTVAQRYTKASALSTALQACINGKVVWSGMTVHWARAQKPAGPLPEYAQVFQAGFVDFGDGGNERTRISLPTAKLSDFKADGITIDPSSTDIAALIAAVEANCYAKSGAQFNEYLGGRIRSGRPRRRTNLYNGAA